jgi:nucleoside-diphosphate-sugar epimerase
MIGLLSDQDEIFERAGADLAALKGSRILITGGTGFIGKWLVASIVHANLHRKLNIQVQAVGRDNDYFGKFDAVIHGSPALPVAWKCPLLYLSSGAVTARHRPDITAEKTRGESMVPGVNGKIARLFSFIGPGVPDHYAAARFFVDDPISVEDPMSVRSWMYPTDLVVHLWNILVHGGPFPYEVGSTEKCTLFDLAGRIAEARQVHAHHTFVPNATIMQSYVPGPTQYCQTVSLEQAIKRTLAWHRA